MKTDYTFRKEERLSSRKSISNLFEFGNSFAIFPFRVFWAECDNISPFPAQTAFTVSKKLFKKAVARNRIKRLMREAWRHNKHILYDHLEQHNIKVVIMLIYTSKEMPQHDFISNKVSQVVSKLLLILPDSSKKVE